MEVSGAIQLLDNLTLKPGWQMETEDSGHRFEQSVSVTFVYPAHKSEREYWPSFAPMVPFAKASYTIMVGDLDDIGLYRAVLDCLLDIESHEWREFLRVRPTGWAPFHPHRMGGMKRWGNIQSDLHFGLS